MPLEYEELREKVLYIKASYKPGRGYVRFFTDDVNLRNKEIDLLVRTVGTLEKMNAENYTGYYEARLEILLGAYETVLSEIRASYSNAWVNDDYFNSRFYRLLVTHLVGGEEGAAKEVQELALKELNLSEKKKQFDDFMGTCQEFAFSFEAYPEIIKALQEERISTP